MLRDFYRMYLLIPYDLLFTDNNPDFSQIPAASYSSGSIMPYEPFFLL